MNHVPDFKTKDATLLHEGDDHYIEHHLVQIIGHLCTQENHRYCLYRTYTGKWMPIIVFAYIGLICFAYVMNAIAFDISNFPLRIVALYIK